MSNQTLLDPQSTTDVHCADAEKRDLSIAPLIAVRAPAPAVEFHPVYYGRRHVSLSPLPRQHSSSPVNLA